jgi:signal transduction histidine kinase
VNATGRLSLRARLLVLLIAVTAAFLLVMGGVTTFVLARRLSGQFNADLAASAARSPRVLASNPAGDVAVVVSRRVRKIILLTPSPLGTEFAQALKRMGYPGFVRGLGRQPFPVVLADGTKVRTMTRLVPAKQVPGHRLPPGVALLAVGRPPTAVGNQLHGVVVAELITGGALLVLLALSGRWLIGRGLAPLSEMAGTAQRITSRGDLTARMPDSDDSTEVGRLGAAINTMLDRIQQAFGARLRSEQLVRQFAADASHELRTPLTTIRGYAELYRQGALGPGQLPDAMRRIEQEATRMSTLVAELLELARLDRTSSLDLAETDLAALVRDAAADAHAVEPARPVRVEAPSHLVAVVDEARVRQVLANLLGNVREHTPAGTPAAVRLAASGGGVLLEVADSGPGMAPADAARAFDRFHRGGPLGDQAGEQAGSEEPGRDEPGRAQGGHGQDEHGQGGHGQGGHGQGAHGQGRHGRTGGDGSGGSGLGLAIVQAIARAHGGDAVLESVPGQGTRVRVWLPAAAPPGQPPAGQHPAGQPPGGDAQPEAPATGQEPAPGPAPPAGHRSSAPTPPVLG